MNDYPYCPEHEEKLYPSKFKGDQWYHMEEGRGCVWQEDESGKLEKVVRKPAAPCPPALLLLPRLLLSNL